MSDTYRDLGGGITDPDDGPDCSWRCDGMGLDRFAPAHTRGFVECPVHRPIHHPTARAMRPPRHLRVVR